LFVPVLDNDARRLVVASALLLSTATSGWLCDHFLDSNCRQHIFAISGRIFL
jgi:hypothetical protein